VARTFTLTAPVWRILHQVSCSSETVTNAPKRKETQQNMSLGSIGMDRERRYEKFRHDFVVQTFALIAPVGAFCSKFRAVAKRFQMHPNGKEDTKTLDWGPMVSIRSVRCEKC
jgi:hypothetical protein